MLQRWKRCPKPIPQLNMASLLLRQAELAKPFLPGGHLQKGFPGDGLEMGLDWMENWTFKEDLCWAKVVKKNISHLLPVSSAATIRSIARSIQ